MVSHRVSQKWSTEVSDMYSEVFTIEAQNKVKIVICIHCENSTFENLGIAAYIEFERI